ncbi:response regulator, partial [Acinetobacter baumannii]
AKILLIEDDQSVATAVVDALEFDRHIVECFFNGEEGFERLISFEYDLVLLDWSLPGKAGIEILKDYRARGGNAPII